MNEPEQISLPELLVASPNYDWWRRLEIAQHQQVRYHGTETLLQPWLLARGLAHRLELKTVDSDKEPAAFV